MARTKFVCNSCGYESGKWYGRCPECSSWNSFEEVEIPNKQSSIFGAKKHKAEALTPQKIGTVASRAISRLSTGFAEFDRVLGGTTQQHSVGIVPGSVILLSGDPGIGKSTLLLQLALTLGKNKKNVLYITGEESEFQVKMRAERIEEKLSLDLPLFIVSTTDIDRAVETIEKIAPDLVIIDSVQTMATTQLSGFPGSVPQIRYVTSRLISIAKTRALPVFMVGHVTKEGIVAGPMVLSHMVDVVLYLEGEALSGSRILRSFKNRFGDTSEVGIFLMEEKGLVELDDATEFFMSKTDESVAGSCITVVLEGSRPLLVEVQALVVPSNLSFPRRVSTGIAHTRLELLLAVIQKHTKIPVDKIDVFVNVVGGLQIKEPAIDLAVCLAILSSFKNKPLSHTLAIGEVGLLGEVKKVPNLDKRVREAKKFGFKSIISAPEFSYLQRAVNRLLNEAR